LVERELPKLEVAGSKPVVRLAAVLPDRPLGEDGRVSDCWRVFDVAVARWRLGELTAERLPTAAMHALSAGCDAPSLGQLAVMEGAGWSEIEPVLARVLDERGRRVPSEQQALKCVADDIVQRMVAGEVAPEEAADRLRHLSMNALDRPAWHDLATFHHLSLDWEVAERARLDRDGLRAEMLREGRELLARGGVRVS
jgi:hypothetical protein